MLQLLLRLLRPIYDRTLRPFLPAAYIYRNGVLVPEIKALDVSANRMRPEFKAGYIDAIRTNLHSDDTLVEIGTGRGVATVVAARHVKKVISFEGSPEQADLARRTVHANVPHEDVDIITAVVGDIEDAILFEGASTNPMEIAEPDVLSSLKIDQLPSGDVLLLDCEGMEIEIIASVGNRFNRVIVEAHPAFEAGDKVVRDVLQERGFTKINRNDYNSSRPDKGVFIASNE